MRGKGVNLKGGDRPGGRHLKSHGKEDSGKTPGGRTRKCRINNKGQKNAHKGKKGLGKRGGEKAGRKLNSGLGSMGCEHVIGARAGE